jgi:predicted permease
VPGFAALAVTILATGIGASTVMYTLVQSVLLRELPFQEPERLVWRYNTRTERDRAPLSVPDLEDYRREASGLSGLAVFTNWTTNLTGIGTPERLDGVRVSGNFFELLGTTAALGRTLQPDDETRERRVAVLTYGLWQRRFGGDSAVVVQDISLNGATYTVVGVLRQRFLFPFREAEVAVPITLHSDPRRADRGANFLRVVARLAPEVTLAQATGELDAIAHRLQRLYPTENARKVGISLYPLHTEIVRDYRGMLWTLFASVGVLLLVGCVNLANLLLVRATGRQTEFAVRTSLGASEGQLVRQLLGETALLAVAGGVAGLGLVYAALDAWRAWGPADFPHLGIIGVDWRVLLFAVVLSSVTALVCGLAPAWFASRKAMGASGLGPRTNTTSRAQWIVQRVFVAAQMVSLGSRRANVRLLQAFGLVALVLCAIGVYGVTAFAARMRRRELAIRSALGASRSELMRAVLGRELFPVLLGLGAGCLVTLIAAPYLFGGAFDTSPHDVRTYLQVAMMLLAVAVLATYIPVRRAGAGNPSEALTP